MSHQPPRHVVAAGLLVFNGDQVLLVRTPRRGWEFPGGQIEMGESVLDGVVREVKEESRINAHADRLVGVYSNVGASRIIFDFLGTYQSGKIGISDETIDVAWVDPDQARQRITHPGYSRRLEQLLDFDGRVLYQSYTNEPFTIFSEQYI
jgi:8-oxo-dGTP diphosphatase